jgi:hypothetical protein
MSRTQRGHCHQGLGQQQRIAKIPDRAAHENESSSALTTTPPAKRATTFTTSPEHHRPRMKFAVPFLITGLVLIPLGALLVVNDLPAVGTSEIERVGFQWMPVIVGAAALVQGTANMLIARAGAAREGDDAIDLVFTRDGITVRGGHEIGWASISGVTAVRYSHHVRYTPKWMLIGMNHVLEVRLKEPVDVPRLTMKNGEPCLVIDLLRYPRADYKRLLERSLSQFEHRCIPVDTEHRWKWAWA